MYIVFQRTFIRPCNGSLSGQSAPWRRTLPMNILFGNRAAAVPVGRAGKCHRRRISKATEHSSMQPFFNPAKSEIAHTATTTAPLHSVVGSLLKHDIKCAFSPVPSSRIHTFTRRAAVQQKKSRESRLCNPVLGRGTGGAVVVAAAAVAGT